MMNVKNQILKTPLAEKIYESIKDMPIVDYHCHLSPQEILDDKPFSSIGEMWLAGDHYKWRLMRAAGVSEGLITGDASFDEKFDAYVAAVETAVGNPLKDWSALELEKYFGISEPLCKKSAAAIRKAADAVIKKEKLSPRKLIKSSNVQYIATTDDPADSLDTHKKLGSDKSLKTAVVPTFRADNLFNIRRNGFAEYVKKLQSVCGAEIKTLKDFLVAIDVRMSAFGAVGCRFADIGIEAFPNLQPCQKTAAAAFEKALKGEAVSDAEFDVYIAYLYHFWLALAKKYDFIVQLHLNVQRNTNTRAFKAIGADSGFDTVGNGFSAVALKNLLDGVNSAKFVGEYIFDGENLLGFAQNSGENSCSNANENICENDSKETCENGGLPEMILYSLNPADLYSMITLAGSYAGVKVGVPWWFNDHKRGITEFFRAVAELSHINTVVGMLTDSRSFLSYARHDYFRMLLASFLSDFSGEDEKTLIKIAENLSYYNAKNLIEKA